MNFETALAVYRRVQRIIELETQQENLTTSDRGWATTIVFKYKYHSDTKEVVIDERVAQQIHEFAIERVEKEIQIERDNIDLITKNT